MVEQTKEATEQRDELVERLFGASLGAIEVFTVYLGDRLGLYQALSDGGPVTSLELAAKTGTHERYAREWLEQQAVTGILEVDDADEAPEARRYSLPPGHAEVLLDHDSLAYIAPLARFMPALGKMMPEIIVAFRTGGGVSYADYGADAREAQAALNRPQFLNLLGNEWLPAIPDVHQRLQTDPPARVADIACGAGWSSIAIARAYPKVRVDGYDNDEASVEMACTNVAEAGLEDRVSFHVCDAAEQTLSGNYDLVTVFEAIHDLSQPVEVLMTARRLAGEDGAVIVMDERVTETFAAPGDLIERFFYGASVLFCLPIGMAEQPSAGTGTAMRPDVLRVYATEAGFGDVEILPIEHDMWRFYRLLS